MEKFLNFYNQYSPHFLSLITFLKILMYVNLGFTCKKVWGKGVKITASKFITGALFISVCILSANKIFPLEDGFLTLTSLFMGYGTDNLMIKFIKGKYWDKFDVIDKDKKE